MSNSSRVSNRMLQRARLGELDEQELAALLKRLQLEDGGAERLEQAIQTDQQFLQRHPADQMTPLIRNRLERRKRASHSEGETMLSTKTMFWRPAAAPLLAGALGVALTLLYLRPVAPPEVTSDPAEPIAAMEAPPQADPKPTSSLPLSGRIDRRLSPLNELILAPGFPLEVDARGITRVEVDLTRVVPPPIVSDDKQTLSFVGLEPGLTGVRFHYEDRPPDLLYVRVAPFHSPDEQLAGGISSEGPATMMRCDDLATERGLNGRIVVRVLTTAAGNVATAYVESSTVGPAEDVEECLTSHALQAKFAPTDGPRTALYQYDFSPG